MSERHDQSHRTSGHCAPGWTAPAASSTWRSLEALSDTPEFKEFLHREFPQNASEWLDPVGRRGFLKLMSRVAGAGRRERVHAPAHRGTGAVRPAAGRTGARQAAVLRDGHAVCRLRPSVCWSRATKAGRRRSKATRITRRAAAPPTCSRRRRFSASTIPDRSRTITNLGEIRPFSAFFGALRGVLTAQQSKKGAGLRILTETVASPTLGAQMQEILTRLPEAKWVQWEPVGRHNAREGSRLAFGEYVDAQYALDKADVVLSLDADFMCTGASGLRHARAFAVAPPRRERRPRNRLYAVESTPTDQRHVAPITGCRSGRRRSRRSRAPSPRSSAWPVPRRARCRKPPPRGSRRSWQTCRPPSGRSVVIAGETAPPAVHALAHAMNAALGNVGQTVVYTPTVEVAAVEPAGRPAAAGRRHGCRHASTSC